MKVAYDSKRDTFSIIALDFPEMVRLISLLNRGVDATAEKLDAKGPLQENMYLLQSVFESADLIEAVNESIKLRRRIIGGQE